MNDNIPNITFDMDGICSYCHLHNKMEKEYPIAEKKITEIVSMIRSAGKKKKYDCIIGISGGCDSSYLLYKIKEYGLRPLAVTLDNGWGSDIASNNIRVMTDKLDVDLYTYTIDNSEFNDISRSFLYASVPDADIPSDIAISKLYYMAMNEYDLDFSICGHSFRTEGTVPVGWTYMDGKYIESVHKTFGKSPFKTFLNLDIDYWLRNLHKKRIRLLYHTNYDKEEAKNILETNFGWKWYGAHHFENEYTKFIKSYLLPRKFNIDKRYVEFSALVRSGYKNRDEAIEEVQTEPKVENNFIEYVIEKLGLSKKQFYTIMNLPIKTYLDYETYKEFFVKNRDMLKEKVEKQLIPRTFFEKYTA